MKKLSLLSLLITLLSFNVFAEDRIDVQTCSKRATEQVEQAKETRKNATIVFKPIALGGEIVTAAFGAGYVLVCGGADAVENASRYSAREIKEAYQKSKEVTLTIKDKAIEKAISAKDKTLEVSRTIKDKTIETTIKAKDKTVETAVKAKEKTVETAVKAKDKSVEMYMRLKLALIMLFSGGTK